MPRLTVDELDAWIAEFRRVDALSPAGLQALDTSWDQTTIDTALVLMRLDTSDTDVYLQRVIGGTAEWTVTFEARDRNAEVSADEVDDLAAEVAAVGRLCRYLTARTAEHLAAHAPAGVASIVAESTVAVPASADAVPTTHPGTTPEPTVGTIPGERPTNP